MIFAKINTGAIFMMAVILISFMSLVIAGIYYGTMSREHDKRQLIKALEINGLTDLLLTYQDKEDWRFSSGKATHKEYGRVLFQTIGVKSQSTKILITNLRGRKIEDLPLIIA